MISTPAPTRPAWRSRRSSDRRNRKVVYAICGLPFEHARPAIIADGGGAQGSHLEFYGSAEAAEKVAAKLHGDGYNVVIVEATRVEEA